MEGWLQVPPSSERNLIGRAQWKPRFVRFTNCTGTRSSVSTGSSTRPTTAGSINLSSSASVSGAVSGPPKQNLGLASLERSQSTHQVSALASAAATSTSSQSDRNDSWTLSIYKAKTDTEPTARYPIHKIASVYIGDICTSKKKSLAVTTLVINLRSDPPSSSSRTFRRRSNEPALPAKEKNHGLQTLLFRPHGDDSAVLTRWVNEIQDRLLAPSARIVPMEESPREPREPREVTTRESRNELYERRETYDRRERFERFAPKHLDLDSLDKPSIFLVNGEPNSAFLSPSIRSKNSNLSSIDSSDDRSSMISSSPSTDRPQSAMSEHLFRTRQHSEDASASATPVTSSPYRGRDDRYAVYERNGSIDTSHRDGRIYPDHTPLSHLAGRRETILDRFFSTAPPSPGGKMSSIARLEALLVDHERTGAPLPPLPLTSPPPLQTAITGTPRRIPSPTQRALEFVSSARRDTDSDEAAENSTSYTTLPTISAERDDSDNDTLSSSGSYDDDHLEEEFVVGQKKLGQGKRHSLAIASLATLGERLKPRELAVRRRGSCGDLQEEEEEGRRLSSDGRLAAGDALRVTGVSERLSNEGLRGNGRLGENLRGDGLFREFSF
ncbi:Similar to hypothetical protein [Tuber melanosporum Mel28]; acc. no. XP_002837505 [Pyronema omphalodes CBS 100304]|uniref:Uncharacterized protein n=1 Tax=Pyronema omphalodes (strain CBS 100304) TaxID=1076935 RepID=U4L5C9_PYROM|nr:Similar to hypothetical protein [Tuber melanosporum Mel28]; acc. no. XP_002837505 [Pyronema omphalodes CBS 100304]